VKIVGIIFDKHPNCMFFWKDPVSRPPQDLKGKDGGRAGVGRA
jgi:hypothetical protein